MPQPTRAALSLIICEGLDCAEAAAAMGVSVGTMESLLVRGRRHLRTILVAALCESGRKGADATSASPVMLKAVLA